MRQHACPALLLLVLLLLLEASALLSLVGADPAAAAQSPPLSQQPAAAPAWQYGSSLAEEVAAHLGIDAAVQLTADGAAPSWEGVVHIRRALEGSGFHRTLHLHVQAAAPSGGTQALLGCGLSLLLPLPSSIFADPYELEDLTRSSSSAGGGSAEAGQHHRRGHHGYAFKLLGPLDLELPAPACQPTTLLLGFDLTPPGAGLDMQEHQATLLVPLHAKYPQPQGSVEAGVQAALTGHATAVVPWPWLVADCRDQQGSGGGVRVLRPPASLLAREQQQQEQQQQAPFSTRPTGACDAGVTSAPDHETGATCQAGVAPDGALLWRVPAGDLGHLRLVSWGTLLVAAACCVAVSWTAVRHAGHV